jgi:hypothetical protein
MIPSCLYSHSILAYQEQVSYQWEEFDLFPFNELIISWNAFRPEKGKYTIYISVKIEHWSPWLLYAYWGKEEQRSFLMASPDEWVRIYQDIVEIAQDKKATGFRIRVEAEEGASLNHFIALHVCASNMPILQLVKAASYSTLCLDMPGLSQLALSHVRNQSMCSPTSITATIRYILQTNDIEVIPFAQQVWDAGFDIFGHWVFNVAQAFTYLGRQWRGWVARLTGFDDIFFYLKQKIPIVVSVKGNLQGSLFPYHNGHLIAIRGYDAAKKRVLCMDPAYPLDHQTLVSYDLNEFLQAWQNRHFIAYVFSKIN